MATDGGVENLRHLSYKKRMKNIKILKSFMRPSCSGRKVRLHLFCTPIDPTNYRIYSTKFRVRYGVSEINHNSFSIVLWDPFEGEKFLPSTGYFEIPEYCLDQIVPNFQNLFEDEIAYTKLSDQIVSKS